MGDLQKIILAGRGDHDVERDDQIWVGQLLENSDDSETAQ